MRYTDEAILSRLLSTSWASIENIPQMSLDDFYGSQHDEDETDDEETDVDETTVQRRLGSKELKVFMARRGRDPLERGACYGVP